VSTVNGHVLGWERFGSGPRVLFCNGSGRTLADAKPMLEYLAGELELLAWDYRGFGQSGLPGGAYTMADLAGDAVGLLELAGWDSCRIVGVSFGGMVAQEFAVTYPERVDRLALMCTSSGGEGGSSYPLHELLELPEQERVAAGLKLVDSRWNEEWFEAHPSDRVVAERFAPKGPPDPADAAAHRAQLEARAGHDVWDRLSSISCPTLVASGRYDGIAPVENGRAIASRIAGADFREYEGGHAFLVQDQAAVGDLVAFLRGR
jgi:pimeloyl-ACP methyl ester carboxylesterase